MPDKYCPDVESRAYDLGFQIAKGDNETGRNLITGAMSGIAHRGVRSEEMLDFAVQSSVVYIVEAVYHSLLHKKLCRFCKEDDKELVEAAKAVVEVYGDWFGKCLKHTMSKMLKSTLNLDIFPESTTNEETRKFAKDLIRSLEGHE